MIWEILQMVTEPMLFGCVATLIFVGIGTAVSFVDPYSTEQMQRNWMILLIVVFIFTLGNLVVFSISTVNVKHLEKEQVSCIHKCECPECGKVLETHEEESQQ